MQDKKKPGKLWIEYVDLAELQRAPRNPKLHDSANIHKSIRRHGFTDPVIIDERTGLLVAGHGRFDELEDMKAAGAEVPKNIVVEDDKWLVPVIRGNYFKDDKEAEAYILTCNRLVESGGWDLELVKVMIPEVKPIGFAVVEAAKKQLETSNSVVTAAREKVEPPKPEEPQYEVAQPKNQVEDSSISFDQVPGHLKGVFELNIDKIYNTENIYGIPELREDMLLEKLPPNLKTWGDIVNTPDDGESHYFLSYGSGLDKGCPFDRTILSWYSQDSKIETWWKNISWRTGQMLNSKLYAAVVPDFSIWYSTWMYDEEVKTPPALQMLSVYRAQWMGRFLQDAGLKVIPRLEYFAPCNCLTDFSDCLNNHEFPCVKSYSMIGVPKSSPVLAVQMHTGFDEEHFDHLRDCFHEVFDAGWCPNQLLVYAGVKGRALVESLEGLPCEVIIIPTTKLVRKQERTKETDPMMLELKKRKKEAFSGNITGGSA